MLRLLKQFPLSTSCAGDMDTCLVGMVLGPAKLLSSANPPPEPSGSQLIAQPGQWGLIDSSSPACPTLDTLHSSPWDVKQEVLCLVCSFGLSLHQSSDSREASLWLLQSWGRDFSGFYFSPKIRKKSTGEKDCHVSSSPQFLLLLVFATCPCIAVTCFQPQILLGAPCCAWGPKQGRRKILSGPCCENLAGLANSASSGCNGLNQTQVAALEIFCTTSFTSEAKQHEPPLLPTLQGRAEHRSSLSLHNKPRVSDTPTSHNWVLLLLSQAAFSLLSSPVQPVLLCTQHRTGQGPAAELIMSDRKIQ